MQRHHSGFSIVEQYDCINVLDHDEPCCTTCPIVPSNIGLPIPEAVSFPGAMISSHNLGSGTAPCPDGLPGLSFDQFEAGSLILDAVAQNEDSHEYNPSAQQGPLALWSSSPSADQVLLDVVGMDTRASGSSYQYMQGGTLIDLADHLAYDDTKDCAWDDSYGQSSLPNGPSNSYLSGNTEEVNMTQSVGQHNTSLLLTDCNEAVNALSLDDVSVDPIRDLQQPSQQLSPEAPLRHNLHQTFSNTNSFVPPSLTFDHSCRDMPWTSWTPLAMANRLGEPSSLRERHATGVFNSAMYPELTCCSTSALSVTDTSDTSSHPYLMPDLSATQGPQSPMMDAEQSSQAHMAEARQRSNIVLVGRRFETDREGSARPYLSPSSCLDGVVVDGGVENASLSRSSSNRLSVPSNSRRKRRSSSPARSVASITPSVVEEIMACRIEGCSVEFTGTFRRGNLHRHIRLIHKKVRFPCGVRGCVKIFNRQDSRLKHYRKQHADDLPSLRPPLSRGHHEVG